MLQIKILQISKISFFRMIILHCSCFLTRNLHISILSKFYAFEISNKIALNVIVFQLQSIFHDKICFPNITVADIFYTGIKSHISAKS